MKFKAISQIMANMARTRATQVLVQVVTVQGVGTVIDDLSGTSVGGQSPEVGDPLLGYEYIDRMLGVIHMGTHRDDGRNRAVLGNRRTHENRQIRVPGEIPAPSDPVHNTPA